MSATAESLQSRSPLGGLRPLLMLVGVAAAVAAGVAIALWSKEPTYTLLVSKVSNSQASQIVQALEAAGIPHRADTSSGSVLVPAERLNDARLKLAGQGIGDNDGGFDTMSKDPGFGVSQFMESARYQHALEMELAKTIGDLQPVEGARVHLALPQQSAFVRDRRSASASVFVQLKAGHRLAEEQVTSIVNLVASSIPDMDTTQVTVVDQQGHLLSAPHGNDEYAMRDKQLEFAQHLEETYSQRIEQLLTSLVGAGRVHAQVVADVQMSVTEETREQYQPESKVVRSEQESEESSRNGSGAQGVPGALTNQPPQGGVAAPAAKPASATPTGTPTTAAAAAVAAAAAKEAAATNQEPQSSSKQSTRNYEIDRTLAYTRELPGKLKRLSVAVLVDNAHTTAEDGTDKVAPYTPDQLASMTKLVKDAVGFDEKRGDSVSVINAAFTPPAPVEQAELQTVPIWEKPFVRDIAKIVAGLIVVVLLVFQVLKPLLKNLMTPPPQLAIGESQNSPQQLLAANSAAATSGYDQQVTDARGIVQQDPKRVAQVVKGWVAQGT